MTIALAVDIGGTKVEAALVSRVGELLPGTRFREATGSTADAAGLEAAVTSVVRRSRDAVPNGSTLVGAGIGAAGPIVEAAGLVSPLNLPAWRDYPVKQLIESLLPRDTPVTLRMDGLCITLAEHWVGAARGYDNVLGMIVSTGIGGGLILHGNTVSGPTGNAGHIGHLQVAGSDSPCACGGTGCLEAIASGPRTVAWARERGWNGTTGEDLAASYLAGDEVARRAVERAGTAIGEAIASATALVDLEVVTIGGGFSAVTPDLFDYIRAGVATRQQFPFVTKVLVVPSGLSSDGPLIGAAALVHRADLVG